ncbi:acetate/propionate family kinase [Bradyrhizobium cenepequi]
MSVDLLLTFNAGSSTVKLGLFELSAAGARRLAKGEIDFRRAPLSFRVTEGPVTMDVELTAKPSDDLHEVMDETLGWLAKHFDMSRVTAVGHRVVHGGDSFAGPVRIEDATIAAIDALTILAPLHQPQSVRLIRAIRHLRPSITQAASFDTAFHRTNRDVVRRFAIPRALHDQGLKRYGFHGLSYKYIAGQLARRVPEIAAGKVVAAHLGSGASICALEGGVSRDSSMGFSTLDGIPMATRCGALDPGVLLHLLGPMARSRNELEQILYHHSGLLGASGVSADTRELLASDTAEAREAIDLFTFRIAGEIARLAATLGGLDAVVFTAGIGEHQPPIRAAVCERLAWLGLRLDTAANAANAERISAPSSRIAAFVISTDEEQVIADEALAVLSEKE